MYQRILVAVDLSRAALAALDEAHALASSTGAALAVVHVMPDYTELAALHSNGFIGSLPAMADLFEEARDRIRAWARAAATGAELEVFLEQGAAAARIVERAEDWGADLVVIGGTSDADPGAPRLGTVAKRVLHGAQCPVLVSRDRARSGVILAATDLSDPSLPAMTRAAAEAHRRGARLVVLHVVDPSAALYVAGAGAFFGMSVALPPPELRLEVRDAMAHSMKQAMQRIGAHGEALVRYGSPAETIVECAKELGASLVVVGTHGRTGLLRIAIGSVADAVAGDALCSVLVVRHSRGT